MIKEKEKEREKGMYNTKAGTVGMVIIKASGSDPDGWNVSTKWRKRG
jgi:hypothetical protein